MAGHPTIAQQRPPTLARQLLSSPRGRIGTGAAADPAVVIMQTADFWWDAKDLTASTDEHLPNRNNDVSGDRLTFGSNPTASDTNDPLRSVADTEKFVYLPGVSSNYFSVPDEAALDVTGDIDLRADIAFDDYTPAAQGVILSKYDFSGTKRSYYLGMRTSGDLFFVWTEDGTTAQSEDSTVSVSTVASDGARTWVRATMDVDNGASGYDIDFYTSTDGSSWTPLGATVTGGATTSIYAGVADVLVGAYGTGSLASTGKFYRAQIYDGIAGSLVLDVNPDTDIDTTADPDAGQTSFVCTTGQTVTVNRSTSGLTTLVNPKRSRFATDGSDDYGQMPAGSTPSFTKTTGQYTAVLLYRDFIETSSDRLLSWESSSTSGLAIYRSGLATVRTLCKGTSSVFNNPHTSATATLQVVAIVIDDGDMILYTDTSGFSATASITGLSTEPVFDDGRIGIRAYDNGVPSDTEAFAALIFDGTALSEADLDLVAAKLIDGDYS